MDITVNCPGSRDLLIRPCHGAPHQTGKKIANLLFLTCLRKKAECTAKYKPLSTYVHCIGSNSRGCELGRFFIEFKSEFSIFVFASSSLISSPAKIYQVFSSLEKK